MRSLRAVAGLALALAVFATPAAAHRLKVFAAVVGTSIDGKAYFVGGGPASGVPVTLRRDDGTVIAEGLTASDGRFSLAAPVRPDHAGGSLAGADLSVVVDSRDGHVARFAIAQERLPVALPAASGAGAQAASPAASAGEERAVMPDPIASDPNAPDPNAPGLDAPGLDAAVAEIEAAVAHQIAPLSERLDALESGIRLRDVLGGLGYVAGIFGLLAFLSARRGKRQDGEARR